jgi:hypothetical protein
MVEGLDRHRKAVVCFFCGLNNLLPAPSSHERASRVFTDSHSGLSIVRCHGCGKEAIYLAAEFIQLKETSKAASSAA